MRVMHHSVPDWVSDDVRAYLSHVVGGEPIRAVARRTGCHASTVLRQVRRTETLRDDPLIDTALARLGTAVADGDDERRAEPRTAKARLTDVDLTGPASNVLRRLAEPGACLAVADGMEKAVIVRETPDGQILRTGSVERVIAEAMALRDWIAATNTGRITRYRIRPAGRVALKEWAQAEADRAPTETLRGRMRYGGAESPLLVLGRRRDRDGTPFLTDALVKTGERLREEYELAGLTAQSDPLAGGGGDPSGTGPDAARARVAAAAADLGEGLADVVLAACCHLEGMEEIERRMGWAARSGKIVLRIGLKRLQRHFLATGGTLAPRIG